jgi:hypothetical protein
MSEKSTKIERISNSFDIDEVRALAEWPAEQGVGDVA